MMSFLDTLVYAFLSFSHVWMALSILMLFLRRRKFRSRPSSFERRFYQGVIGVSMMAWVWNGIRPTPVLFEERVGLYWGIKVENASWHIQRARQGQPAIARSGRVSMAVQFQNARGWIIFHHFPTAPPIERYEALEFNVLNNDLRNDTVRLALYSDGKMPHPADGLALDEHYRCGDESAQDEWVCYRVPLGDFGHPGGGLIGVAFVKGDGVDEGTYYLDDVRLIAKRR